jgi:Sulfotransferase family
MTTPSRSEIRRSLRTSFNPTFRWRVSRARLRLEQASHVPALIGGGELKRPILIIGAPRSGTHMIFRVLGKSARLAHWRPSEAHEVWEADHHPALRGWESNVLDGSDANPESVRRIRREFLLVAGTKKRLLDKNPRNVLRIGFIEAVLPDAHYIFIKRDGRDTVNSLINAWRGNRYRTYELPEPHNIPGADPKWWKFVLYPGWRDDTHGPLEIVCAKQWLVSSEHLLKAQETIPSERWMEVAYEDYVEDPVAQTKRIAGWLDVPLDDDVRAAAEAVRTTPVNIVTPPEKDKWRKENPDEIEAITPLIRPMMERLGYPLDVR